MPLLNAPAEVRDILGAALPGLTVETVKAHMQGCDSHVVEVNGHLIFKFPKTGEAADRLRMECGILAFLAGKTSMPIPRMSMLPGPIVGSMHEKLPGEMLESPEYEKLSEARRDSLAARLARFYADLHQIPPDEAKAHGARPIKPWLPDGEIAERTLPRLPGDILVFAKDILARAPHVLGEPDDIVFGFFDGHGWNMAFDHAAGRLNGVYDFADCGLARRHLDLHCSNWISPDLTLRVIYHYESLTGIAIERERVMFLTALLRLNEHASGDPDQFRTLANLRQWRDYMTGGVFRAP